MKTQWKLFAGLLLAMGAGGLGAAEAGSEPASGIYRSVDENGNVVFTDQRPESGDAEEVKLRETNTVPIEKVEISGEVKTVGGEQSKVFGGYRHLEITSPAAEATIRNPEGGVQISVDLQPALQDGDTVVIFDNGVQQTGLEINAPERGVHVVIAKVLGEDGEVKIESAPVEFYIHQSTAYDFRRRPGLDPNGAAADVGGAAGRGGAAGTGGAASTGGAAETGGAAGRAKMPTPVVPRPNLRN